MNSIKYCVHDLLVSHFFKKLHESILEEKQVLITLVYAQLVELLCTIAANRISYTNVCCMNVALVLKTRY